MQVNILSGKYVLAVSGGVDSMSLLDILAKQGTTLYPLPSTLELVVAHFNHGIRPDSAKDQELVAKTTKEYDLPLEIGYGRLGNSASEDKARDARYTFLQDVKKRHTADAIITAHHQDDLIETAFINILRGTGRRGLSSIRDSEIIRPLLETSKQEIIRYAKENNVSWIEDQSNKDLKYLRNHIRLNIMAGLSEKKRAEMIKNLDKIAKTNHQLDIEITTLSQVKQLDRGLFIMLPEQISSELLIQWLRLAGLKDFDRKAINRSKIAIKTAAPGTRHEISGGRKLFLTKNSVTLE